PLPGPYARAAADAISWTVARHGHLGTGPAPIADVSSLVNRLSRATRSDWGPGIWPHTTSQDVPRSLPELVRGSVGRSRPCSLPTAPLFWSLTLTRWARRRWR